MTAEVKSQPIDLTDLVLGINIYRPLLAKYQLTGTYTEQIIGNHQPVTLTVDETYLRDTRNRLLNVIQDYVTQELANIKIDKIDEKLPSSEQVLDDIVKDIDNRVKPAKFDVIVNNKIVFPSQQARNGFESRIMLLLFATHNDILKAQKNIPKKVPSVPPLDLLIKT